MKSESGSVDNAKAIEWLEIFVESARELELSKAAVGSLNAISVRMDGAGATLSGPNREAVKAMVLTARMFCQDNDTSIRETEKYVDQLDISGSRKKEYSELRSQFNSYLQAKPVVLFEGLDGAGSNGEIFWSFVYGVLAHSNRDKRRRVKKWKQMPEYEHLRAVFQVTLFRFVEITQKLADVCEAVLVKARADANDLDSSDAVSP